MGMSPGFSHWNEIYSSLPYGHLRSLLHTASDQHTIHHEFTVRQVDGAKMKHCVTGNVLIGCSNLVRASPGGYLEKENGCG